MKDIVIYLRCVDHHFDGWRTNKMLSVCTTPLPLILNPPLFLRMYWETTSCFRYHSCYLEFISSPSFSCIFAKIPYSWPWLYTVTREIFLNHWSKHILLLSQPLNEPSCIVHWMNPHVLVHWMRPRVLSTHTVQGMEQGSLSQTHTIPWSRHFVIIFIG